MTGLVPPRGVRETKITEYLLNPAHEVGGPKAAFFLARGFRADQWRALATALTAHPERNPVEAVIPGRWGTKYVVRCRIETPDGSDPCILSVWLSRPGGGAADLITAYPAPAHP